MIFEVFRQERKGQPFAHAGSVEAPDAAFADAWAREQYGRRGESEALWLVPRDAVHQVTEWADEFDLKYRRVDGYSIKARLKEARERAGTAAAELADDELILGWRDSEWTGIAPTLEEDVAFSSIAQNEIGHARALYELAAVELGSDADALAFDRAPDEYRCAPLVELRLLDWAHTIARRYLYEEADRVRIEALKESDDAELAGLAAKIDREEVYHRLHAEMWAARLRDEPRFATRSRSCGRTRSALLEPEQRASARRSTSCGRTRSACSPAEQRARARARVGLDVVDANERGEHTAELAELWNEMTEVRRSVAGCAVVTADAGLGRARGDPRPGDPGHLARRPRRDPRRRRRRRPRAHRVHADVPRLPRARGDEARARGEGRRSSAASRRSR